MTTAQSASRQHTLLATAIALALTATGGALAAPGASHGRVAHWTNPAAPSTPSQTVAPTRSAAGLMAPPARPNAIVAVTNCNDSGTGSLRAAAALSGIVVADLSDLQCSTISLTSGAIVSQAQQLFVQGPGAAALTIDGNRLDRVFYAANSLTLTDLTIRNGNAPVEQAYGESYAFGGCIAAKQSLVIADSVVTGCQAGDFATTAYASGGGVASYSLSLVNSTLSNNHAYASYMAAGGGAFASRLVSVHGSTVSGNAARSYYGAADGGGVFSNGDLELYSSVISDNLATSYAGNALGGGAFVDDGATVHDSTISGNSAHTYGGFAWGGGLFAGDYAAMYGSTVASNVARSYSFPADGGGVFAGDAYLYDTSISDNLARSFQAPATGGGVWTVGADGSGVTLSGNEAHSSRERAVGGGMSAITSIQLQSSTVSGNSARGSGARGGGLAAGALSGVELLIDDNSVTATDGTARGGGAYVEGGDKYATSLYASRVTNNSVTASGGDAVGGGLAVSSAANTTDDVTLYLAQTTLDGNSATTDCLCFARGGGAYVASATSGAKEVHLYASTISHNTVRANDGVGVGAGVDGPALNLANVTVAYNVATAANGIGGGLNVTTGDALIENSTIADNSATNDGGGINFNSGGYVTTLVSSIIYGNVAGASASDARAAGTVAGSNNLVGAVESGTLPSDTISVDPLLQALADNGGPTQTMALAPDTSPAINVGANPDGFTNDQRGGHFARRAGAGVDIGAYEVQPAGGDIIFIDGFDDGPER